MHNLAALLITALPHGDEQEASSVPCVMMLAAVIGTFSTLS